MAWTASLLPGVERIDGIIRAVVRFTDGTASFDRDFSSDNLTPQAAKEKIHAIIEGLNARDALFASIKALEGTTLTPAAPTPPDAALNQFVARWNRLRRLKALQPYSAANTAALTSSLNQLQGQVEAYLVANPTAIDAVHLSS